MCSLPPWKAPLVSSLSRNIQASGPPSGFVQLATVNAASGLPNCRTVAFRGFLSDRPGLDYAASPLDALVANTSGVIRFTSDIRTDKIRSILARPVGELCWYHASTLEQYRLSVCLYPILAPGNPLQPDVSQLAHLSSSLAGKPDHRAVLACLHKEREQMWYQMHNNIQTSMAWPSPGEPLDPKVARPMTLASDADVTRALDHFVLLLAVPWRVDRVELGAVPFRRTLWHIYPADHQHPELDIAIVGQASAWTMTMLNP